MNLQLQQVKEFHRAYGVPIRATLGIPDKDRCQLRAALIAEEARELLEELTAETPDITKVTKEMADLLYVVFGSALELGLQNHLEKCFSLVHTSNMSKLGEDGKPILREDGKVQKGPNYKPADLSFLVK